MRYSEINGIEKKASRLVFGTGTDIVSGTDGAYMECLDMAWENGFTTFDSAYAYGDAEKHLGEWMDRRGCREDVILLDKGCNPGQKGSPDVMSAELIRSQQEESLHRLRTDYVDLYLLHRDDPSVPVGEIIEVLNERKALGKIRRFGVSNWTLSRIIEAEKYADSHGMEGFTAFSPAYSYAELVGDPWGRSVTLSGEKNREAREWYQKQKRPVFTYSSLARGYLSGKFSTTGGKPVEECLWWAPVEEYDCPENRERLHRAEVLAAKKSCTVSQICLAWLLGQPLDIFPIVSPSKEKHMKDNVGVFDLELTLDDWEYLDRPVERSLSEQIPYNR